MRHGDKINNLGRKKAHREALLSNLAIQLITHKRIVTTLAKAKALRTYVEPLVTKTKKTASKEEIMHNHRVVFSYLNDKAAVKELFTVVAPKIAARPGGYTRIIKLGNRLGDNAEICFIELVDFNETKLAASAEKAGKTRRSRRGGAAKATEAAAPVAAAEVPSAEVVEEAPAAEVVAEEAAPEVAEVEAPAEVVVEETTPEVAEEAAPEAPATEESTEEKGEDA